MPTITKPRVYILSGTRCDDCSHPYHRDQCVRCDESAQVGCYAPCSVVCQHCGDTATIELHSPDGHQSITICAGCGSDE